MTEDRREELKASMDGVRYAMAWDKNISLQNFMENYVYLPKTNAFDAGRKVRFAKSPHLIKPMKDFDRHEVQEIWLMFASQMAKTLFEFGCWAKTAKVNPKSIVWMISKKEAIPTYQDEKINALIEPSPVLHEMIEKSRELEKRHRDKKGKIKHQGTSTTIIGSKNDDDKKSISCKLVLVDEADEMNGIGAISPLWERAKTFINVGAKLVVASTKKKKDGTITEGFNSCEQKNFLGVECPHCKKLIEVIPENFIMPSEEEFKKEFSIKELTKEIITEEFISWSSEKSYYKCNECEKKITEEQKKKQILSYKVDWIVKGKQENAKTVGYSANSILSFFLPFESISRAYYKAYYIENENKRNEAMALFYEGYFNVWYDKNKNKVSKSDDILMLDSGIPKGEISENCSAIYMTIDSQKGHKDPDDDHYWYVVGEFDSDLNWRKIESGKIYDEKKLYTIMCKKYNFEGKERRIRRVVWDIQGHGEVEVLAFIHKVNKIFGQIYKYEKEERNYLVYPYRGKEEILGKTYNLKIEKKQDKELIENSYPLIEGNSKRAKDELFRAMSKTIKYRKGKEVKNPEQRCWYIDETEALAGKQRLQNKIDKGQSIPAEAFEMQMVSEVFGVMRNGKEGYETTYAGRPNHYLDCCYMQYVAKDFDNLEERIMDR